MTQDINNVYKTLIRNNMHIDIDKYAYMQG